MSLTFEPSEKSKIIANMYKNKKFNSHVYYDDLNDIEDESKILRGVRLNNDDEIFFINITDFKENEQVDTIYITGQTGCGKSSWIRNYVICFLHKYPKAKVYLFSSKIKDKALDDLPIERVKISDDILENQIKLPELSAKSKPSLCIFDDIEDFGNNKINKEIERLRNEIMRNGRSYGIFCLMVHHDPCDYKATKAMLFESKKIVIFPRQSAKGAYDYLLKEKCKLSKKLINKINSLKSNYVVYNKTVPQFILSDKYILLE
jgi:hypothetical protein